MCPYFKGNRDIETLSALYHTIFEHMLIGLNHSIWLKFKCATKLSEDICSKLKAHKHWCISTNTEH